MSHSVFAWDVNPAVDRRLYPISDNRATELVDEERAKFITLSNGRRAIQLLPDEAVLAERSARNNLIPFGRVFNKLMHPPSLNYPIPAIGARTRILNVFKTNHCPA